MFRLIAKLYIQRNLDYQQALPAWVARRLKHDSGLAKYQQDLIVLHNNLRHSASTWLDNQPQPARQVTPVARPLPLTHNNPRPLTIGGFSPRWRFVTASVSLATAALVIILVVSIASKDRTTVVDRPVENASSESTNMKPRDQQVVKVAVNSAERLVQQVQMLGLNQNANATAASSLLAQLRNDLPLGLDLDKLNSKSLAALRNCVGSAGKSTGQFFNQVGSGFRGGEVALSDRVGSSVSSLRQSLSGFTQALSNSILQTP